MIRKSLFIIFLLCAQGSMAQDCVDANGKDLLGEPEEFTALIEASASCHEAVKLAEACAWGSSIDGVTAGTAYAVCDKELTELKPSSTLQSLLYDMQMACANKYESKQGTMYISMNAYCSLSAMEWIVNLASED